MLFLKKKAAKKKAEDDVIFQKTSLRWGKAVVRISGSTVNVTGLENIPHKGAVLFVGNHEGNFDIPLLLGNLPKPVGFVAKGEMQKIPLMSTWMTIIRCIFLERNDRRAALKMLHEAVAHVKNGHSLIIFPEGTRSGGENMGTFKPGAFKIAQNGGVPIVPFVIAGTSNVYEKNNKRLKPSTLFLKVLPMLTVEDIVKDDTVTLAKSLEQVIACERIKLQSKLK